MGNDRLFELYRLHVEGKLEGSYMTAVEYLAISALIRNEEIFRSRLLDSAMDVISSVSAKGLKSRESILAFMKKNPDMFSMRVGDPYKCVSEVLSGGDCRKFVQTVMVENFQGIMKDLSEYDFTSKNV